MPINVALIGGGLWAKEEHLPAIQSSKDLELRAIYSRTLKSAQSVAEAVETVDLYSDDSPKGFSDLLERSDIQAFVIALPIANQAQYIRAALSAGKHVLSEKPIAATLNEAEQLIKWYHECIDTKAVTWRVAENWRFLNSFKYAQEQIQNLGRILGFRVRIYDNIKQDWRFFQTEWRKNPTHQGGFLLDGGVHYAAGLRQLLGENRIASISAFTTMLKVHLPPVDTVDSIFKSESGIQGTFQLSVGTTFTGAEWTIACEVGSVSVSDSKVTTIIGGQEREKHIADERTGVPPELRCWGEALVRGTQSSSQLPEEALADLELIELMLRSGESNGQLMRCKYQHPSGS